MGNVTIFSYIPDAGFLNKTDPRYKLLSMFFLSFGIFYSAPFILFFYTLLICFLFKKTDLKFLSFLKELKLFLIFLFFIFLSKAVTEPGQIIFSKFNINFTDKGLISGSMVAWKFLCIMLMGIFFMRTTKISEIKDAVHLLLRPIPFIPHEKIAIMTGLFIRFLPVIFSYTKEVKDAQAARCFHLCKNPIKKIEYLTLPVLKKTFENADNIVNAMESRCYNEEKALPILNSSIKDKFIFLISFMCFFITILIKIRIWSWF